MSEGARVDLATMLKRAFLLGLVQLDVLLARSTIVKRGIEHFLLLGADDRLRNTLACVHVLAAAIPRIFVRHRREQCLNARCWR
jgi:hypothetical protein